VVAAAVRVDVGKQHRLQLRAGRHVDQVVDRAPQPRVRPGQTGRTVGADRKQTLCRLEKPRPGQQHEARVEAGGTAQPDRPDEPDEVDFRRRVAHDQELELGAEDEVEDDVGRADGMDVEGGALEEGSDSVGAPVRGADEQHVSWGGRLHHA
jgi:hypothetical protein